MQEEARNSLLKILEDPPARVYLVLTTARPGSMLPTVLSRLRPYRFYPRDAETEGEVIRRVFRDQGGEIISASQNAGQQNRINAYLDSFLPVSGDTLEALASFFVASAAYKAVLLFKKQGRSLPDEVVLLGKYNAPRAEAAGLGRPQGDCAAVVNLVLDKAGRFEVRSLFHRFLYSLLDMVSRSLKSDDSDGSADGSGAPSSFPAPVSYNELWKKSTLWAETAAGIYNLRPAQVLEKLFTDLSRGMAEL